MTTSPTESIEVTFSLTPRDYFRANSQFGRKSPARVRLLVIMGTLAACGIGGNLLVVARQGQLDVGPDFYAFLIVIVLLMVGAGVMGRRRGIRRIANAPGALGPITLTFSPDEVRVTTPDVTSILKWHAFAGLVETADYLCLTYISNKATFQVVPKSAFDGSEQQTTFVDLVESRLGYVK